MWEKLESLEKRYKELSQLISDPEVISRRDEWTKLVKEHAGMEEVIAKFNTLKSISNDINSAQEVLAETTDKELVEMAEEEIKELDRQKEELLHQIKILLLPKDPMDEKNVVVEIRGGAGGEEAALFGAALFRMYLRYAERQGWKTEILSASYTDIGGVKEVIFLVEGAGAYSKLKYESGVHRVQRVPTTESGGRIHTSTATVAVLPEAEDVDVEINPNDIRIDVFRASGHGGQHVNTTDSAVRITHLPTGMIVTCQDEKSQLKNKEKALKVLKTRLLDIARREEQEAYAKHRKSQIGTGDRSERIRTYNYPQGRITDHRIGLTLYQLESFLDGDIQEMLDALIQAEQTEMLKVADE